MFGIQSKHFIRTFDTHCLIASTCLKYLCFESLDVIFGQGINTEKIGEKILEGDFILFHYAGTQWIHHVRECARDIKREYLEYLSGLIDQLRSIRENQQLISVHPQRSAYVNFVSFGRWPKVQRFLAFVQDFQYRLEIGHLYTDGT